MDLLFTFGTVATIATMLGVIATWRAIRYREEPIPPVPTTKNDAAQEFLTAIAHDLRTPLQSIVAYADLLRNEPTNAPAVQAISASARASLRMVEDLLDVARLEPPKHLERVDLNDIVAAAVDQLHLLDADERIAMHTDRNPALIDADPARLQQVVTNLLLNALKYPKGPVRVTTTATKKNVSLSVEDQGPGFEPRQIFESLVFPHQKQGSTGLGLALVKKVVEAHGGTIHVQSTSDNRTIATVTLPRKHS